MLPLEQLESPVAATPARFLYPSGKRPFDGYTLKRGVGHGGFGEVYYAVSDAGKEVALKLVRRNLDIELRGVKQCLNLKHPNLLALFDIRKDDQDDYWVVMEFIAGDSLEQVLAKHPNGLPEQEALRWFRGVAAGVAYLHDHGVVHRDLKPGNIFSDEGIVKIGDYGLSKFISCSRRSGQTGSVGTVHYMAPEISNGRYGKEIDIYALGVMLYEMLTGLLPFEGESLGEILMKHLTAQPNLSKVGEPYRSVIARALEKDPAKRFSNVGEMLALLPGGDEIAKQQAVGYAGVVQASTAPMQPAANPYQAPQFAQPLPVAQSSDLPEEPIARWVVGTWREFWRSWEHSPLPPGMRTLVSVLLVVGVVFTIGFWLPFVFFAGVVYLVYFAVRSLVLGLVAGHHEANRRDQLRSQQPPPLPVMNANDAARAATTDLAKTQEFRKPWARPKKHLRSRAELIGTPRERARDLVGSLLLSPVVIGVLYLLYVLMNNVAVNSVDQWNLPNAVISRGDRSLASTVWAASITILATWVALILGKIWESRAGEPILRRFAMLVVGLLLGGCSWLLASWLGLSYYNASEWRELSVWSNAMYQRGQAHQELMLLNIASLGVTFALIAWWHQCDPLRTKRFSLIMLGLSLLVAFITHLFLPFMQPWGLLIIGVMSVTLQLTARWIPLDQRTKIEVS